MKKIKLVSYILLITFLFSQIAFADTIYFYHTDPAGTPIAMTDASGSVVWKADYKPFGEEWSITSNIENNKRFVGKEKDAETGLNYFGARYMSSSIGRFISTDPVGPVNPATGRINQIIINNPQRLNLYSYGLNNPYKYVDTDGKWPTRGKLVHQQSIDRSLSLALSENDRNILKQQQVGMDTDTSSLNAYKHAMRSPEQNPTDAWMKANDFTRKEIAVAKILEGYGFSEEALKHLGNAMHTVHDSTDPEHSGYQIWDEKNYGAQVVHAMSEFYDPIVSIDIATVTVWRIFTSNKPIPKEVLPKP